MMQGRSVGLSLLFLFDRRGSLRLPQRLFVGGQKTWPLMMELEI